MKGRGERRLLSLIEKIDNKDKVIVDLILEIYRLRRILEKHGIDYKTFSPISPKNSPQKGENTASSVN